MMTIFTVHQGKRYRATIVLGWVERWATNAAIAAKLRSAALTDATAKMPAQIRDVAPV
jgi:hypothetical protein